MSISDERSGEWREGYTVWIDDPDPDTRKQDAMDKAIESLTKLGIEAKPQTSTLRSGEERRGLALEVMRGEERVSLKFSGLQTLQLLAKTDIAGYQLSPRYIGIVNPSAGIWEAKVAPLTYRGRMPFPQYQRLVGETLETYSRLELAGSPEGVTCVLGDVSPQMRVLERGVRSSRSEFSLRVQGLPFDSPEKADEIMTELANSVLFSVDLEINVALKLLRRPEGGRPWRRTPELKSVKFPDRVFDEEPMSLYWYAQSAEEMPLLQFLALYQVLEFYFPVFAQASQIQEAERIIKNPSFSIDHPTDVAKLVSAIEGQRGGKSGNEGSQLKATISKITNENDLRALLDSDPQMADVLCKGSKGLAANIVNLGNGKVPLTTQVATRIYEIRCRIVHTKSAEESDLLLPFSPGSYLLGEDIKLLRYLAQQALVVRSKGRVDTSPSTKPDRTDSQ